MSNPHILNTLNMCRDMVITSTFSCEEEKWDDWVDVFQYELDRRKSKGIYIPRKPKESPHKRKEKTKKKDAWQGKKENLSGNKTQVENKARGSKVELVCWCGSSYSARIADLKRGWGLSCCKSCAAIKRDFGRRDPVCKLTGEDYKTILKQLTRTDD